MNRFLLSVLVLLALVGPASADWYGTAHNAACGRMNNEQLTEELKSWQEFDATLRAAFHGRPLRVIRGRDFIKVHQDDDTGKSEGITLARFYTTLDRCMADMLREFPGLDPER